MSLTLILLAAKMGILEQSVTYLLNDSTVAILLKVGLRCEQCLSSDNFSLIKYICIDTRMHGVHPIL